jgi:hypothetical protein
MLYPVKFQIGTHYQITGDPHVNGGSPYPDTAYSSPLVNEANRHLTEGWISRTVDGEVVIK